MGKSRMKGSPAFGRLRRAAPPRRCRTLPSASRTDWPRQEAARRRRRTLPSASQTDWLRRERWRGIIIIMSMIMMLMWEEC